MNTRSNKNIAIFASGAGSNAQKIIDHFISEDSGAKIVLIVCNNPQAGVLKIAGKENIPTLIIEKNKFNEDGYVQQFKKHKIKLIVLAGFLWKLPAVLIRSYPHKIINIHPALLPQFGGKGMYGDKVHQAVIDSKEKKSGITIHYVDELYDHGKIIFQTKCTVDSNETIRSLAAKIHILEHIHYPVIIEKIISTL
jgi:phosphoribosylglycinamide formyltransferase-1